MRRGGCLLVAVLAGCGALRSDSPAGPWSDPRATVQLVDLGERRIGDPVEHVFEIENTRDQPLELRLGRATCDCAASLLDGGVIAAYRRGRIRLAPAGALAAGLVRIAVTVATNDPARPRLGFVLRAELVPDVAIDPEVLWLPDAHRGAPSVGSVRVRLPAPDVRVESVAVVEGAFVATFEPAAPPGRGGTLVVRHPGRPERGLYDGRVLVRTTSARQPRVEVPVFLRFR